MRSKAWAALAVGGLLAGGAAAQQGQVNVICSVQADWCNLIQTVYAKTTGVKVNMSLKGSGEALAQLIAERANPKTDVWFGGTGDPHLQAAEQDLTLEYKSASLPQLHEWAQQQAKQSGYKTVGIYSGPLGFGYNTELLAKKKIAAPACWKDLIKPELAGEVQMANPNASGTAYTAIATLVQVMGEEPAFDYMKKLNANVNQYARSGIGPMTAVTRGEVYVGSTVLHGVINEIVRGFPVLPILPCEGVGYEIGSTAVIKGTRNLDAARKFVDFALSPAGQQIGLDVKEFAIPTNRSVALPPQVPKLTDIKVINYDFAKYGSSETRKRLLERWEKEIGQAPR